VPPSGGGRRSINQPGYRPAVSPTPDTRRSAASQAGCQPHAVTHQIADVVVCLATYPENARLPTGMQSVALVSNRP